jgi:hypothetical protein
MYNKSFDYYYRICTNKKTRNRLGTNKKPGIPETYKHDIKTISIDKVSSLDSLLKLKESGNCVKTLADDGCILLKYKDGFIKKICDRVVTEIIHI